MTMRRKRVLYMAWENMKLRRFRTSLTTLGVVIGITAIIALASLGEGFRTTITERMEKGFELDVLTVIPGSLFAGLRRHRFTEIDVQNINTIGEIKVATPVMQGGNATLYSKNRKVSAWVVTAVNFTEFWGVFPERLGFEDGELPEVIENDTMVLGYRVNHPEENVTFAHADDNVTMEFTLLKGLTPVSKNCTFKVAGTLRKSGASGLTNFDYWLFIPIKTARDIYEVNQQDYVDLIFAKLANPEVSEDVAKEIDKLFPPYQISVLVPSTFISQVNSILNMVEIFLTSIASIALLVAGIGIMNITTVSVMERTREIGILKAIGAKSTTVLTIFLTETALIGLMGGLIGIPTGYGISFLLSLLLSSFMSPQQDTVFPRPEVERAVIRPVFSLSWTIGALAFGIVICVLFGLYPSRKAAKLDPVEALRYE